MAEGGELSSSVRGSGVDFEYVCTPCADEGNSEKAMKYCPECKEYLCAACIKCHVKFSATKKHILHGNEYQHCEGDSVDNTSDEEHVFKCVYHPDRDIEMYCFDHEMVYCLLCVAKEHRHCSRILELEEAAVKITMSKEDDLLREIDSLQADIQATRQKKEANLISLDMNKNEILNTIEDTEHLLIDKVKALASDAKAQTYARYDGLKRDIKEEDSVLLKAISDTDELRKKLKTQSELGAKGQFARYMLHKHIIAKTRNTHDNAGKVEKKMKCFKNNELIQEISTADCFVQVVGSKSSYIVKENLVQVKSKKDLTIKGNGDKETCAITGICQLFDGTVILTDRTNKKIKMLNKDFIITKEFDLEYNPAGLCLTGKTEIAVKLINHTVLFISIGDTFTKTHSIYIEGGNFVGLVSFCNELWCYTGNDLKVYDRSGMVTKTFNSNSFVGTLFQPVGKSIVPLVADDEFIYVSDLGNKVACLDRKGNVWWAIENERLALVRKACITRNGIILIGGCTSGNIMMFKKNGECIGELVGGLIEPDSLWYDINTSQLIFVCRNTDTLTIIKTD